MRLRQFLWIMALVAGGLAAGYLSRSTQSPSESAAAGLHYENSGNEARPPVCDTRVAGNETRPPVYGPVLQLPAPTDKGVTIDLPIDKVRKEYQAGLKQAAHVEQAVVEGPALTPPAVPTLDSKAIAASAIEPAALPALIIPALPEEPVPSGLKPASSSEAPSLKNPPLPAPPPSPNFATPQIPQTNVPPAPSSVRNEITVAPPALPSPPIVSAPQPLLQQPPTIDVPPPIDLAPAVPPPPPPAATAPIIRATPPAGPPPVPKCTYVNKRDLRLNFDVGRRGSSGIKAVELWARRHSGTEYECVDRMEGCTPPFVTRLGSEGDYEFRLVLVGGTGVTSDQPSRKNAADLCVCLDTTPPLVEVLPPQAEPGETGVIRVRWKAEDSNLTDKPIRLDYSLDGATWLAITGGEEGLPNTGAFAWKVPENLPSTLHLRVRACDKAGNVGEACSPSKVPVDFTVPEGKISGVMEELPAPRQAPQIAIIPFAIQPKPLATQPIPAITIKTAMEEARVGTEIPVLFEILNRGSAPLKNLLLEVELFGGLRHPEGPSIRATVNEIGGNRTQEVTLRVKPSQRGEAWLRLRATSDDTWGVVKEFRFEVKEPVADSKKLDAGGGYQFNYGSNQETFVNPKYEDRPWVTETTALPKIPTGSEPSERLPMPRKEYTILLERFFELALPPALPQIWELFDMLRAKNDAPEILHMPAKVQKIASDEDAAYTGEAWVGWLAKLRKLPVAKAEDLDIEDEIARDPTNEQILENVFAAPDERNIVRLPEAIEAFVIALFPGFGFTDGKDTDLVSWNCYVHQECNWLSIAHDGAPRGLKCTSPFQYPMPFTDRVLDDGMLSERHESFLAQLVPPAGRVVEEIEAPKLEFWGSFGPPGFILRY